MREPVFTGACSAIVTPFDQSGAVNYDRFGRLIDEQIARGLDAICVCGTTGECATLSIREHIAAVEYCVKRVNHRVKVIAGAGSNDTSAAVYLSQHAQDSGADALLHVTPYYNKASQTGLIKHYEYIADRVELPIILYNVPSRTGVDIKPETIARLAAHPRIVAVGAHDESGRQGRHFRGGKYRAGDHDPNDPPLPGRQIRGSQRASAAVYGFYRRALPRSQPHPHQGRYEFGRL